MVLGFPRTDFCIKMSHFFFLDVGKVNSALLFEDGECKGSKHSAELDNKSTQFSQLNKPNRKHNIIASIIKMISDYAIITGFKM